ncbi:hypothetical protein G9464_12575 [Halostella sp. JP-L12]|uniref:HalOD1 output domain-containing protein n=1 Tax=Halostella TaxID=1843185 RepID=UPI000EF79202|nr:MULTISPECIES: HalOD1 output domain-containing protein [Halostella]NHN48422.1 hypothetical protein [Halostella sp. JP-L12]
MNSTLTTTELAADSQPVSQTVVLAVAEATGDDPLELPPLFDTIDPDALNKLFDSSAFGADGREGQVEFTYAGCDVTVRGDERVAVSPVAEQSARVAPTISSD